MPLYLIPTFLSENTGVLSEEVLSITRNLDEFVVENEKSARAFLKAIKSNVSQDKLIFHLLNEHSTEEEISGLLHLLKKKKDIGLLSEAGCPAVADPGAALVMMAHEINLQVIPLTGPSSIILALMGSGFNGQQFIFHGYLPRDAQQRRIRLKQLESDALKKVQTQIFIETPYRNQQVFNDILQSCSEKTFLCIACNLTSAGEFIRTLTIKQWKTNPPDIYKKPVVFLIGS